MFSVFVGAKVKTLTPSGTDGGDFLMERTRGSLALFPCPLLQVIIYYYGDELA